MTLLTFNDLFLRYGWAYNKFEEQGSYPISERGRMINYKIAAFISLGLWVIVGISVTFLYATGRFNSSYPIELVYKTLCDANLENCQKAPDAISLAVQLGRLDWVSTALAILGAGTAMFAIMGFTYAKDKAEAKNMAQAIAEKTAKETATKCAGASMEDLVKTAETTLKETTEKFARDLEKEKNKYLSDFKAEADKDKSQDNNKVYNSWLSANEEISSHEPSS